MTMKTQYTAFRCPVDLLAKAKARAAADRRSLSNYVITLIEKDVKDMPMPRAVKRTKKRKPAVRRKAR
jgi:hypothetical protein